MEKDGNRRIKEHREHALHEVPHCGQRKVDRL